MSDVESKTTEEEIPQQASLDDLVRESISEQDGTERVEKPAKAGALPTTDPNAPKPFELPGYTKAFNQAARDAIAELGGASHNRKYLDPILAQFEETNKYVTTKEQEYASFKKSAEPIWDIVAPLESQYRMQGMSLQQGIGQMVEAAKFVASDPDQAFPWFAQMYQPRDPGTAVMALAKQWGVDLGQVVAEQPYVDPQIAALVNPLQKEIADLRQWRDQQGQSAQRAQQEQIVQEIAALEAATDENGSPKYPHLNTVFPQGMQYAVQMGATTVDQAYEYAVMAHPQLRDAVLAEKAKAAEAQVIQAASVKSVAAQQAARSNRPIAGKGQRREASGFQTLDQAARAAIDEAS